MWFIPMIIWLYICIPIIKKIIESKDIMKYFLLLSLLFAFIIPMLTNLMDDFGFTFIEKVGNAIEAKISNINPSLVMGYTSYFILGYLLNRLDLKKKYRGIIYVLGILGVIMSIALTFCISTKKQEMSTTYYGNFSFCVLLESVAIFTLFKYHDFSRSRLGNLIPKLASYSFGVYMVHILVRDAVRSLGLTSTTFTPLLSVPLMSIIIFLVSNVIAIILKRIPILRKYVV